MTQLLETEPSGPGTAPAGDGLNHYFCCDPDMAYCGTDISGYEMGWAASLPACIVCVELEAADTPCGPDCPYND